jgi:hypothetical protein
MRVHHERILPVLRDALRGALFTIISYLHDYQYLFTVKVICFSPRVSSKYRVSQSLAGILWAGEDILDVRTEERAFSMSVP